MTPRTEFARQHYPSSLVWALVVIVVIGTAAPLSWVMYSAEGRAAYRERQVAVYQTVRARLGEARYQELLQAGQREVDRAWYRMGVSKLISSTAFLAGTAFLIHYLVAPLAGRTARYRNVLGIVSLAASVFVIEAAYTSLLTYLAGTLRLAGNLEALVPARMPPLLAAINPFFIWWIALVSLGIHTLFSVPTRAPLTGLLLLYTLYVIAMSLTGEPGIPGVPRFHGT